MKKLFLLLPIVSMLFACNAPSTDNGGGYKPGREYGDDKYYALFMYNYPRVVDESANGYQEKYDNPLYLKQEIQVGELIAEPETDPERAKYEFQGWFRETSCVNPWNFEMDTARGSTYLYAKWGIAEGEEYIEPEYVYPERIIEDMDFRITGILNRPVSETNNVNLTAGGINRLKASPSDVRFAINYERKENVTLTSATYNNETKLIHVEVSSGATIADVRVNDITNSLNLKTLFPGQQYIDGYETKAKNYEAAPYEIGNFHVALGGSSSMENWTTSTEDMAPIASFNHGIGGTTVENWTNSLLERLITPYRPKLVVYYVGVNNIINANDKGDACGNKLVALFDKTHEQLPEAKILYILINKLPGYANKQSDFDVANAKALAYENSHDYMKCVDAGVGLLKDNGLPHYGYFRPDGLHMSRYGYVIWGAAVKNAIMDMLGR